MLSDFVNFSAYGAVATDKDKAEEKTDIEPSMLEVGFCAISDLAGQAYYLPAAFW